MAIEHKNLPNNDLHEPKGAANANKKEIYIADGLGSGSFQPVAIGSAWVDKRSSSVVVTGSGDGPVRTSTVLTGGTAGNGIVEFKANDDASLEYIGDRTRHIHIAVTISVDRPTGTSTQATASLEHFDSSAGTWSTIPHSYIQMEVNTNSQSTAIHADIMMDKNDKLAVALENTGGSADLAIGTQYIFGLGVTGE